MCVSLSPREMDFGYVNGVSEVKRSGWSQSDEGEVPVS